MDTKTFYFFVLEHFADVPLKWLCIMTFIGFEVCSRSVL